MEIVTTTAGLEAAVERLNRHKFVALDTEFMRDQTYWPKLCLVQAAVEDFEAVIDPLAPGIDLKTLYALMRAPDVLKVFHAARQDIEVFWHMGKTIPEPLFDTQIAAMVCGFGESVGYETLVRRLSNTQIDKSMRFTDWAKRPLSERQMQYALSDVTHLRTVYARLARELEKTGRANWVAAEMKQLTKPSLYELHPENAWKRLRTRSTSRKFIGVLMEIAAWREREAQARDVPRGRVMKDEALVEVAAQAPTTLESLEGLRAVPRGFAGSRSGRGLVEAVQQGLRRKDIPDIERSEAPPESALAIIDLLKVLLKAKAEEAGVAPRLVATSDDIERIALGDGDDEDIPALTGWRREVFGEAALELKRGHVALAASNGRVVLVPVNGKKNGAG